MAYDEQQHFQGDYFYCSDTDAVDVLPAHQAALDIHQKNKETILNDLKWNVKKIAEPPTLPPALYCGVQNFVVEPPSFHHKQQQQNEKVIIEYNPAESQHRYINSKRYNHNKNQSGYQYRDYYQHQHYGVKQVFEERLTKKMQREEVIIERSQLVGNETGATSDPECAAQPQRQSSGFRLHRSHHFTQVSTLVLALVVRQLYEAIFIKIGLSVFLSNCILVTPIDWKKYALIP